MFLAPRAPAVATPPFIPGASHSLQVNKPFIAEGVDETCTELNTLAFGAGTLGIAAAVGRLTGRKNKRWARERQPVATYAVHHKIGEVTEKNLAKPYQLVVVGGGPAGVSAAMKGALLGRRVLLVDKPKLPPLPDGLDISFGGPTGLWSKALRDTAKRLDIKTLESMGLNSQVIWKQVRDSCTNLATQNASYQVQRLDDYKVDYLQAVADVSSPNTLTVKKVDGTTAVITAEHLLMATGSLPVRLPDVPFDDIRIYDSDTINKLDFLPKNVCVCGSGIIAIEYAKIFRNLGAEVTLLVRSETRPALARMGLDPDIVSALVDDLIKDGVTILEGCEAAEFVVPPAEDMTTPVTVKLKHRLGSGPQSLDCDIYLAAVGRIPNVKPFEQLGCELIDRNGGVKVDANFQTTIPGVYACGDSIGSPLLASIGEFEGQMAVERIFDETKRNTELPQFPVGVWTIPEVSYFGYTLEKAREAGIPCEECAASYSNCLRGRVFSPEGLLKLIFRTDTGTIIGVHIWGSDACEMVHYGMDIVKNKNTIFDLMGTIFTAVTYHELFKAAAFDGNMRLEFGLQWRAIFEEVSVDWGTAAADNNPDEYKAMFDAIDEDNSGELDAEELWLFFQKIGRKVSKSAAANLVRLSDADGSGTIDWDEFRRIFKAIRGLKLTASDKEKLMPA